MDTVPPPLTKPRIAPRAIASLVMAVLSFTCLVTCIPAIVSGHAALGDIRRNPALLGRELAWAGLIIGYAFAALMLFGGITLIFAPIVQPPAFEPEKPVVFEQQGLNEMDRATAAGAEWLSLIDRGEYGKSWDEASPLFQAKGTREYWINTISAIRKTYGPVESRTLAEVKFIPPPTTEVHQFIKVAYDTKLADREIREVVTLVKDGDGNWRASGY